MLGFILGIANGQFASRDVFASFSKSSSTLGKTINE
jgi:hypothetical protein